MTMKTRHTRLKRTKELHSLFKISKFNLFKCTRVYTRVSQTFLQMAPFKEIKIVMAPFNKITHKLL